MPIILSQFSILIIVRICGFHRETMFTFHYPWNQDTTNAMRFHKHGAEIIVVFCISLPYVLHWISHFIRYIKYVSVDMTVSNCIIELVFKGRSVKSFKLADLKRDLKLSTHVELFSHYTVFTTCLYCQRFAIWVLPAVKTNIIGPQTVIVSLSMRSHAAHKRHENLLPCCKYRFVKIYCVIHMLDKKSFNVHFQVTLTTSIRVY